MKKNVKNYLVIVLTCASILIFGVVLRYSFFYAPSLEAQTSSLQSQQDVKKTYPASYPKELRIPSINVNSKVTYVGKTTQGNMATPSNFTDVGWFKYGAIPGENGNAVIAGHVNNGIDFPAVFGSLHSVKKGDDIFVDTIGGKEIHFVVTNIKTYDYNAPTVDIFSQSNGKFLKLITCSGVWVEKYKTHDKRLVVTAEEI